MASNTFSTASQALPVLMQHLLRNGDEVGSRNGRVKELLNVQIMLTEPWKREILCEGRKANVFAQIAETAWVLAGRNDIEWLSAYLPRAVDYSDDGKVWRAGYGPRIRAWGYDPETPHYQTDQLAYVVDTLRADPLSRQAVIGIWDPDVDTTPGKDRACNTQLQFQSRLGALHLTVTVRSNDLMWGWSGINAFEWSTLQEIVASMLGIRVGTLTFNIGSLHLYEQHWDKAARIKPTDERGLYYRQFDPLRRYVRSVDDLDSMLNQFFQWEELCRIGKPNIAHLDIQEPMFRTWAYAIAYFWTQDDYWLKGVAGTALAAAMQQAPASVFPVVPGATAVSQGTTGAPGHNQALHDRTGAFYAFVTDLHAKKHASYGNSWKKRGEKMSILANMARKVDRLGVGDEFDSSADTVIDLLVYAIKYECWLVGQDQGPEEVNAALASYLRDVEDTDTAGWRPFDLLLEDIGRDFDFYADNVDGLSQYQRHEFVAELATRLTPIARDIWHREQDTDDSVCADHD